MSEVLVEDSIEAPPDRRQKASALRQSYEKAPFGSATEGQRVEEHLPLVKTVVGRMAMLMPAHVSQEDLYSAGLIGLLNAVRNYDPSEGASFETYARLRIRGAVLDELRRMDWVPRIIHSKVRQVQAVMQELEQRKGDLPTDEEMARALKLSLAEYQELLDEIRPATFISLDVADHDEHEALSSSHDSFLGHVTDDPAALTSRRELAELMTERIQQLPEAQRKVLALYYYEDMRLGEIAVVFGVSVSRICQLHTKAILAIRSYLQKYERGTI